MSSKRAFRIAGIIIAMTIGLLGVLIVGLRLMWPDIVREQARSVSGHYAEVLVDGAPLSGGIRVVVWTAGWPHWQPFGCTVLESYTEQPIELRWIDDRLEVKHGYPDGKIVETRTSCGSALVKFSHTLLKYS